MIVNADGTIRLERRAPFAYLKELTDEMREVSSRLEGNGRGTKTDSRETVRDGADYSSWLHDSWEDKSLSEPSSAYSLPEFLQHIAFPQRAHLARFTNL